MERRPSVATLILAAGALAAIAALLRLTSANLATVAVTLLLAVVAITGVTSRTTGVISAAAAALTLNFFFLPPFGTLHIAEADDWILFLLFILASLGTSSVVSYARREADDARQKRAEIEAVYRLGVELFSAESRGEPFAEVAHRALVAVGAKTGALFVVDGEDARCATAVGGEVSRATEMRVRDVISRKERVVIERAQKSEAFIPLLHQEKVEAVLVAEGPIDPTVIESLGTLLSLALDRERYYAMQLRVASLHESDLAKTSVIRAVAHDLSTPLTALRIQIDTLNRLLPGSPTEARLTAQTIAEEAHRLQRRIRNLLTMARIEAGRYKTLPEPTPVADLFKLTKDSVRASLGGRPITISIDADCGDAFVDPSLCLEILTNLIENAHAATNDGLPIELSGKAGIDGQSVRLLVGDRGAGIPATSERHVDDEGGFGLGLHIARAFSAMSGGTIEFHNRDGGGTIAMLTLPSVAGSTDL